jgi:uncharacterized membrane protein YjgN (DUF898 family)
MSESVKETPLVFTGNATKYFGIWIVNLLLSIVTLGIYSAWAKVRRKKYFYNNTLVDGIGFDYHAKPTSILKGRIIAFVFFMAYTLSAQISPFLPAVFGLIFLVALPWLVVRTMTFNARNSSHRGLRFNFAGSVGDAVKVFIGLPLLIIFTLGLIIPYNAMRRSRYLVNNHRFGVTPFNMEAGAKAFYLLYLKALGLLLAMVVAIGALAGLLAVLSGGAGKLQMLQLMQTHRVLVAVGFMLIYVLILITPIAFMQARLGNLIWNSATLDKLSFRSTLRARDMLWLYVSNLLAIVCSFGLLTPWVHVRMSRYRAENLTVLGETDFERFVGDKKAEVSATGEELADFFDVDLSFG